LPVLTPGHVRPPPAERTNGDNPNPVRAEIPETETCDDREEPRLTALLRVDFFGKRQQLLGALIGHARSQIHFDRTPAAVDGLDDGVNQTMGIPR